MKYSDLSNLIKIGHFDVTVPASVTTYKYSSSTPSDFNDVISATSVAGDGLDIKQINNHTIYLFDGNHNQSTVRILYAKTL